MTDMNEPESVGKAHMMPGASGFTMACFNVNDVPDGTLLYTEPMVVQPYQRSAIIDSLEHLKETINTMAGCTKKDDRYQWTMILNQKISDIIDAM